MPSETRLRPMAFTALNSISDCSAFELSGQSGETFLSNSDIPLDEQVFFRQTMNAEALFDPSLRYGLEVEIAQKSYAWMSLEMHLPMALLADHPSANFVVSARAASKTTLALGYGGILDRGRGFDCFTYRPFKIGHQYKTIATDLQFSALPMDELEGNRFVLALYFNDTDATTVTLSDFRLDLY